LVHNGIIENYLTSKTIVRRGRTFIGNRFGDVAHLIDKYLKAGLVGGSMARKDPGSYALVASTARTQTTSWPFERMSFDSGDRGRSFYHLRVLAFHHTNQVIYLQTEQDRTAFPRFFL
jgi:hypothetical protein